MTRFTVKQTVPVPAPVVTTSPDTGLAAAALTMRRFGIHHLVVTRADKVVGILSARDLFDWGIDARDEGDATLSQRKNVEDVMTLLPKTIDESTSLREALNMMQTFGCTALPVVRETGLVGILTETDLVRILARVLEEAEGATGARGKTALASPLVQSALSLLANAGI